MVQTFVYRHLMRPSKLIHSRLNGYRNPLTTGPKVTIIYVFFNFDDHIKSYLLKMLNINRDIYQQDFKIVDPHFVEYQSGYFLPTWSCESRHNFKWVNIAIK